MYFKYGVKLHYNQLIFLINGRMFINQNILSVNNKGNPDFLQPDL